MFHLCNCPHGMHICLPISSPLEGHVVIRPQGITPALPWHTCPALFCSMFGTGIVFTMHHNNYPNCRRDSTSMSIHEADIDQTTRYRFQLEDMHLTMDIILCDTIILRINMATRVNMTAMITCATTAHIKSTPEV